METKQTPSYSEWKSAGELHSETNYWLLELRLLENEIQFMQKMTDRYFPYLGDQKHFKLTKDNLELLQQLQERLQDVTPRIEQHASQLKVLTDGKDELEKEWNYKRNHLRVQHEMEQIRERLTRLKKNYFRELAEIMKSVKLGLPEKTETDTTT